MAIPQHVPLVRATAIALIGSLLAVEGVAQTNDQSCLVDALADADDSTTVGELRALCREHVSADAPAVKQVPV